MKKGCKRNEIKKELGCTFLRIKVPNEVMNY